MRLLANRTVANRCVVAVVIAFLDSILIPSARAGGADTQLRSGFEVAVCPDGFREEAEQCDDGDADDLDGCTSACRTAVVCNATAFAGGDRFAVDPDTGHCYVSFDDDQSTFDAANVACGTGGGHLVTITSALEAALVQQVQNPAQSPWIGASDIAAEGAFAWVTGESFVFQDFAPGQPDGGVVENCLHILDASGGWNDTSCTIAGFVTGQLCEYEPAP